MKKHLSIICRSTVSVESKRGEVGVVSSIHNNSLYKYPALYICFFNGNEAPLESKRSFMVSRFGDDLVNLRTVQTLPTPFTQAKENLNKRESEALVLT